jgi:hypothetical protein
MTARTLATLTLFLAACGEKEAPVVAAAAPDAGSGSSVPDDSNSRKFATRLIEAEISEFRPSDATGASFMYSKLDFQEGNLWAAQGFVDAGDERMECTESGTWSMDPAESSTSAAMTWNLTATNCPGREVGTVARVKVNLESGFSVAFR